MTLTGYKIRAQVQVTDFSAPFTTSRGSSPAIPAGVDLTFEFLFKNLSEVVDVSNFATCSLTVLAATRTGAPYMSAATAVFDNTATQQTWDDGTKQHAVFEFTAAETDLSASIGGTEYYLVLQAKDVSNVILFEAWTRFRVYLDGIPEDSVVVQPGNIVPGGATYNGSGQYSLATATGVFYKWTDGGANDTSVTNGTETVTVSNSNFIAQGATVTLNGTALATVTCVVRKSPYLTADEVAALIATMVGPGIQMVFGGLGTPNGTQTAPQHSLYTEVDGGGALVRQWYKASAGTGNTGWI